jgi:hypothetical protein
MSRSVEREEVLNELAKELLRQYHELKKKNAKKRGEPE